MQNLNQSRPAPVISTVQARSAVTGQNMRTVLMVSLAAVIVGMIGVYFAFFR